MIGAIVSAIFGGGFAAARDAYVATKTSEVERERVKAEVAEAAMANAIEAQRLSMQVRLATAGFWEMRALSFLIAAPFVLHAGAVGLDTTFGLGWRIAAYPAPFSEWEGLVLLSFFGVQIAGKGVTAIAAAFLARR